MVSHKHFGAYPFSFLFGFFAYCFFEIAIRGRTHWTMGILGGSALCMLLCFQRRLRHPVQAALLGAIYITAIEFCVGVYVNLYRGWQIWDYTNLTFQLYGQISLLFSSIWFLLCLFGNLLCRRIEKQFPISAAVAD